MTDPARELDARPGTGRGDTIVMEPFDVHNQRLINNVHPADWQNPEPQERYHLVVIGAGTAGLVTAIVAAGLGAKVALIEKHLMGGDCLNVGCVPSKGVISAARAWNQRPREPFGAPPTAGAGDFAQAMERMRRLRADISHIDGAQRFTDNGVDVFLGTGRFVADDAVEVDGKTLRFKKAVIATGARAAAPPIAGLDRVDYLTNETVFSLTERPKHLLVIGAGPIGVELAQAFARLGSEVTVFDRAPQILTREDADAARVVQEAMVRDGVTLRLGASITAIEQRGSGENAQKVVLLESENERGETVPSEVAGDQLLIAVGRKPNIDDIGLDLASVKTETDGVVTDDCLRTSNPRVFAAGDVVRSLKFTHLADAHAGIVIQNALFFGRKKHPSLVVPWCTYTTPEIAHVGMYQKDAEAKGIATDVITVELEENDRALLDGQAEGFVRVVLEKGSDKILGCTLVADHAGDMIGIMCLAISSGIGLKKFAGTIFPYPTQGEVFKKVANAWTKTRLSPTVRKILDLRFRLF